MQHYRPEGFPLITFYAVFLVFCFALATLSGLLFRRMFGQRELAGLYLKNSFRQALWLSLLATISLVLLSLRLFSWINSILLVLTFVFLESYLISKNGIKS